MEISLHSLHVIFQLLWKRVLIEATVSVPEIILLHLQSLNRANEAYARTLLLLQ